MPAKRKSPSATGSRKKSKVAEAVPEPPSTIPALKFYADLTGNAQLPNAYKGIHNEGFLKGMQFILDRDPRLVKWMQEKSPFSIGRKNKPPATSSLYFERLAGGILSQQISGKAAASIKQKLVENISSDGKSFPSPADFHSRKREELRAQGLSLRKAEYIQRLAKAFMEDFSAEEIEEGVKFDVAYFEQVDDADLRTDLEKFKGIGPWSSSMFAMFAMERLDIFEPSDLGIRRGLTMYLKNSPGLKEEVQKLFDDGVVVRQKKKKAAKKSSSSKFNYIDDPEFMAVIAHQFRPYRTLFMCLLWQISDTSVEAMGSRPES